MERDSASFLSSMSKRFVARHVALEEHRRQQRDTWGGRAIPEDEHLMVLEDHLSVSLRRRGNPYPMFKLQGALLSDLHVAEQAVSECKGKLAELEHSSDGESRQREAASGELLKYKAIRRALRDIGDGIAWRLLGFDRAALSILANHPRKPHINLAGLSAELNALAEEFNHPGARLAVLNDLTHYLKMADITVRVDDNTFECLEVKSSRTKSATLRRQRAKLEETLRFLSEGEGRQGEQVTTIRAVPVVPASYIQNVGVLFREAENAGFAEGVIGEHLTVTLVDWPRVFELDLEEPGRPEKVNRTLERWRQRGDLVVEMVAADRYHEVRNYAPFSVYPLPPLQRVKLMTGTTLLLARVNINAVLRYFESRGWTVVRGPDSHVAELEADPDQPRTSTPVATVKKRGLTMEIPSPWFGRLLNEFLSPRTLVDACEAVLAEGRWDGEMAWIHFAGESKQWD